MGVDHVNAFFEGGGAVVQLLNVRQLLRDKTVRGVHWVPLAFWTAWGLWNVAYYPILGQWWSFAGGLCVVACNAVNLGLMARYWPRGGATDSGREDVSSQVERAAALLEFDEEGPTRAVVDEAKRVAVAVAGSILDRGQGRAPRFGVGYGIDLYWAAANGVRLSVAVPPFAGPVDFYCEVPHGESFRGTAGRDGSLAFLAQWFNARTEGS